MNVTLLSTSDTYGGAPIACLRLTKALRKHGVAARMLVQDQLGQEPEVTSIAPAAWQRKAAFLRFVRDRLSFLPYERSRQVRFAFSPGSVGIRIAGHPLVEQADLLHLHWINFGFLSLASLDELARLGKPLVWTLHDMWTFTGGCHYSRGCLHYQTHCHDCPFLRRPHPTDLSYRVFERKRALYAGANVTFVACSEWLAGLARQSALLGEAVIYAIPNPIDVQRYQPLDRREARQRLGLPPEKKLLLFGAMNTSDPRKGFAYLAEALSRLKRRGATEELELVVFGKASASALAGLPFKVHYLGVSGPEKLIQAYNAADGFVLPSLEDNLPNTVMESLACGTPVVAFRQGGLPEMIDHAHNGYLAAYQSAEALAEGIAWLLAPETDAGELRRNAREKVMGNYTEELVAGKYRRLYEGLVVGSRQ
ncbi:MAG: glycosyltransferase family 4 protein [Ferruginibacter sp.]|nr:glycosyltransferase family 4 protein [Cytophagales bacterium]